MNWWQSPTGQFFRVVLAQVAAAAINAAAANLNLLHLPMELQLVLGAVLHALDEYFTNRRKGEVR